MFFQMHRNKFYLFFLILMLFQPDVFAFNSVIQRNETTSNHYTQIQSDYQRLLSHNNKIFNQYTFSTFNKFHHQDFREHTFISKYIQCLTWFLLEKNPYFDRIDNNTSIAPEKTGLVNFYGTLEEYEEEKKKVLIHALWDASFEVVRESSVYQKYKYYESEIEKYLFIEYSQSISDTNPDFYLPGEISEVKRKEKKTYMMSLSAHLAPDNESAQIGTRVKFATLFLNVKSNVVYSLRNQSTTFSTSNTRLNSCLGGNLKLSIRDLLQEDKMYILGLEYSFYTLFNDKGGTY